MVVCLTLIVLFRCTMVLLVIGNTQLPYTKCNRWQVSCLEEAAYRTQLSLCCSGGWQRSLSEEHNMHLWSTEWGALSACSRQGVLSGALPSAPVIILDPELGCFPCMLAMTVKLEIPSTSLETFFFLFRVILALSAMWLAAQLHQPLSAQLREGTFYPEDTKFLRQFMKSSWNYSRCCL